MPPLTTFKLYPKRERKFSAWLKVKAAISCIYGSAKLIASKKAAGRDKDLEDIRLLQLPRE